MICQSNACGSQSPGGCEAKRLLESSPYDTLRGLSCRCDNGVLYLCGQVTSYFEKQLAQEAVAGITDVDRVVNQIRVAASTAPK